MLASQMQPGRGQNSAQITSWQMGVIADLHYGLAEDALNRLQTFMQAVDERGPECILQLGDFNYGHEAQECLREWRQFEGPKYHVLGNHDMDKATKPEMVECWEMPHDYYSFDFRGWHLIVLDRNHLRSGQGQYIDYARANFYVSSEMRGFADPEQLEWLADDLRKTRLPTVVFAHQGLGMSDVADPTSASGMIEAVLEQANRQSPGKVRACFCGHHHLDRYNFRAGIHYVWINSASYFWVGSQYGRMAAYTEPLYTFLTFFEDGSIEVAAADSDWASPSPRERGFPDWQKLNSVISHRRLGVG